MALVFESGLQTDFDERQIFFDEKKFGAFDAAFGDVLLRRKSGRFAKSAGEMKLAQIGNCGEIVEAQIVFEIRVDKFLDAANFVAGKSAVRVFGYQFRVAVIF